MKDTVIMKFGGASVSEAERFKEVAKIIAVRNQRYRVVVVVSAMGKTTDNLLDLALKVNPEPPPRELDMLLSIGERMSIALLAMALHGIGVRAQSFTGSQSGIITSSDHTDARIVEVRPRRVQKCLEGDMVAIVAGFQGVSVLGEITTLGRGGSDTTAVALGGALGACRVEFYKDVDGVFTEDPKISRHAQLLKALSYSEALQIVSSGGRILHPRCLKLAAKNQIPIHVRSFEDPELFNGEGTAIGPSSRSVKESIIYESITDE